MSPSLQQHASFPAGQSFSLEWSFAPQMAKQFPHSLDDGHSGSRSATTTTAWRRPRLIWRPQADAEYRLGSVAAAGNATGSACPICRGALIVGLDHSPSDSIRTMLFTNKSDQLSTDWTTVKFPTKIMLFVLSLCWRVCRKRRVGQLWKSAIPVMDLNETSS